MRAPVLVLGIAVFTSALAPLQASASAADGDVCLSAAERVDEGEVLTDAEKTEAHEACRRALSATASLMQKYQFEEAIFAITGKRHEY